MKRLLLIFAALLLTGVTAQATTTTKTDVDNSLTGIYVRGYGNSFIFVEDGIEFAIFPDGQFDFNVNNYGPQFGANANFGSVNISFNTGYDYNPYVQYDDYGAVIQIENIPIYYDYYGRITRAGNVNINYNNFGRVSRVGGLYVHYNRYNRFDYYTGFINVHNIHYVYRPWHAYYAIPLFGYNVVHARPYRQYYNPHRYTYYRPYRDNYRQKVRVNGRRNSVARTNTRRSDRYKQTVKPRRGDAIVKNRPARVDRGKPISKVDKPRVVTKGRPKININETISRGKPRVSRNDKVVQRGKPRVSKPKTTQRGKPTTTYKKRNTSKKVVSQRNNRSTKALHKRNDRSNKRTQVSSRSKSRTKAPSRSRSSKSRRSL